MAMRDGTCPNCGSDEILVSPQPTFNVSSSQLDWKTLFSYIGRIIPTSNNKGILVQHYTCTACHLLESYIATEQGMAQARQVWQPLSKENTG